jgi:hypothetical protein
VTGARQHSTRAHRGPVIASTPSAGWQQLEFRRRLLHRAGFVQRLNLATPDGLAADLVDLPTDRLGRLRFLGGAAVSAASYICSFRPRPSRARTAPRKNRSTTSPRQPQAFHAIGHKCVSACRSRRRRFRLHGASRPQRHRLFEWQVCGILEELAHHRPQRHRLHRLVEQVMAALARLAQPLRRGHQKGGAPAMRPRLPAVHSPHR